MHEVNTLTLGERRVFELAKTTLSRKEIGRKLNVSEQTIAFHLGNIYKKLRMRRLGIVQKFGAWAT